MERMGPEALLVRYQTDVRLELAEFARAEFYRQDALRSEDVARGELDRESTDHATAAGFIRRLRARIHRAPQRTPARAKPTVLAAVRASDVPERCLAGRTLAAMPASMAPLRAER
jgi:hypothetical protein